MRVPGPRSTVGHTRRLAAVLAVTLAAAAASVDPSAAQASGDDGTAMLASAAAPLAAYELRVDGSEVPVVLAASAGDPAVAATPRATWVTGKTLYYIESHLPRRAAWPYKRAARTVDKLTGSGVRYGTCPKITMASRYGCIRLYEKRLGRGTIGLATWWGDGRVMIQLNPRYRKHSGKLRHSVLVHEFGHGYGLKHNGSCRSVMYPSIRCVVGKGFTTAERRHLRRH